MMQRIGYSILMGSLICCLSGCQQEAGERMGERPEAGLWRGSISLQGQELPFHFEIDREEGRSGMVLINGNERLRAGTLSFREDSLHVPMHIFDASLEARYANRQMEGFWVKHYAEDYRLPFRARQGVVDRFMADPSPPVTDLTGKWETYFLDDGDSSLAIGLFEQQGNSVQGTFLTPTGDYRYLEGVLDGDSLMLSAFDGEHAFLFKARVTEAGKLEGGFWSGKSWHQGWHARRNEEVTLPDPYTLTYLREGYQTIDFTLPDMEGRLVSLSDDRFRDQVVVVQIFGTWCPNCMDETRFLADWYRRNRDRGVEIVALAFERKNDLAYASQRIGRMKERFNIGYDFLFAGPASKTHASGVLPMLNRVISFPTLIIIDREGKVRDIHTGFSGPGTGAYYERFVEEFNLLMDKLLAE